MINSTKLSGRRIIDRPVGSDGDSWYCPQPSSSEHVGAFVIAGRSNCTPAELQG